MTKLRQITFTSVFLVLILLIISGNITAAPHPSYSKQVVIDTMPFYPGAVYDLAIPAPNEHFKNKIGQWPSRYHEIVSYIIMIANTSDRVIIETHGQSHEERDLFNVIISSENNIGNLEEIRLQLNKLGNPDQISNIKQVNEIAASLPASAWLGYSIHGDEISGVDAAMQLIYHLAAAQDSVTLHLLDNVVMVIDPIQNPDGRERYLSMLQTYQSSVPNYDRHAMQHQGVWPWGRGNHYLFDLNRDWILLTQPETKGKLQTILRWNPQLVVDAHEMGTGDNYLFTPPREPVNYNTPSNVRKWWQVFSKDQATAFDERGWPYYVGEWHEQWYPGYGSAWATYFGSIGILYEQAGVDGMFVKQPNGYLLTYHEAVNHQFTSSLTNLFSLANNRPELLEDYYQTRKKIVDEGTRSGLKFLFIPDEDELKTKKFIESLINQGIAVLQAEKSFTVSSSTDSYGKTASSKEFPMGTYIVSTAQPTGALAKAVLEFDPHLNLEYLKEERRELEKYDETKMYEVSTWNVPLAYDIEAYWTTSKISVSSKNIDEVSTRSGKMFNAKASFAWVVNMVGEKTYLFLNRLFSENLLIYASEKEFTIDGNNFNPGSLVIRRRGNPDHTSQLLSNIAEEIGIDVFGVNTGSSSMGSFLSAPTFRMLKQPKVALLTGEPLGISSFGALWFAIDKELKIPHSLIRFASLPYTDIDKYNVLILPPAWGNLSSQLSGQTKKKIENWVNSGGTLICVGNAAFWAADSATGLSQARAKRNVLEKLDVYDKALDRVKHAEAPPVDTMALWYPEKVKKTDKKKEDKPKLSKKELEDLDEWQRKFSPGGVILNAILDKEDWMTFGMGKSVPVMFNGSRALMAKKPIVTSARLDTYNNLRISGLLWNEARERLAETAYATHESKGKGQLILFPQHPNMRAYFFGSRKLFINAILYGPGFGSRAEGPYNQY